MVRGLILLLAAWFAVLAAGPSVAGPQPGRIVAVGDLHGDFAAWQTIARASRLVDQSGHWAAGGTILVQMGDVTDRGPDSLKIVHNLQQLRREARHSGGQVQIILGNHEAMNLVGDNRYTTAGEYAAFVDAQSADRRQRVYDANRTTIEKSYKAQDPQITSEQARVRWINEHPLGWVEHKLAWAPSGELGRWATGNPAILKINDTLFVHGGISAEYASRPLQTVNESVLRAMSVADDSATSILSDPLGPLWYRGLAVTDPDADAARAARTPPVPRLTAEQELAQVLSAYGARRMVIAHTPALGGIQILFGGRLARIDTGISRYYGGPLTWLEIVGDRLIPHSVPRTD